MDFTLKTEQEKVTVSRVRIGFKSKNQEPLVLIWREFYDENMEVEYATVLYRLG